MRRGFTLIEILLVIGLIGLLVVFSIPELIKFNQRQTLRTVATELVDGIREVQGLAGGGVQDESEFVARYRFKFTRESEDPANYFRGYQIKKIKESGEEFNQIVQTNQYSCPVCIHSNSFSQLDFLIPTGTVNGIGENQASFSVCYAGQGQYDVTVDLGGRVYKSDFQEVSCTCEAC